MRTTLKWMMVLVVLRGWSVVRLLVVGWRLVRRLFVDVPLVRRIDADSFAKRIVNGIGHNDGWFWFVRFRWWWVVVHRGMVVGRMLRGRRPVGSARLRVVRGRVMILRGRMVIL